MQKGGARITVYDPNLFIAGPPRVLGVHGSKRLNDIIMNPAIKGADKVRVPCGTKAAVFCDSLANCASSIPREG
jgi:hypothetical protein